MIHSQNYGLNQLLSNVFHQLSHITWTKKKKKKIPKSPAPPTGRHTDTHIHTLNLPRICKANMPCEVTFKDDTLLLL